MTMADDEEEDEKVFNFSYFLTVGNTSMPCTAVMQVVVESFA